MPRRRPTNPKVKAHIVLRNGKRAAPRKSGIALAREIGMSEQAGEYLRGRMAAAVLTLKPLEKAYFPDGVGGLREEVLNFKGPLHDAMVKAFEHFSLDPEDPASWRTLVEYFAYIFFWEPPRRRSGKPTEWTEERERELFAAVSTLPGLSDSHAAMKLANDKKSKFYARGQSASDGVSGLRRRIGKVKKKFGAPVGTK
ncbi:hypothetical protein [Bradyrhizobium sp. SEMIA]|uniref:hypothetical protein n=1 Tax=Bradyrhizobium sp. SEMIA TaxID=2597515 RepID=UPI0018A448DA|nr:hypothetical protein [Bradyrhizobium sp. SEMIA]QOG17905.1 hypothetical protein FOM02_11695 [Bradyrhizobium sp. SEMIA]